MPVPTARILNKYFQHWLGAKAGSDAHLARLVEAGLPTTVITNLLERGLARSEVFDVIIPLRTWKHRRGRHQSLSREESERAVRAARILARAQAVFGRKELALDWLRAANPQLQGRAPMQMLSTETGGRIVEQMLVQIDEGMYV